MRHSTTAWLIVQAIGWTLLTTGWFTDDRLLIGLSVAVFLGSLVERVIHVRTRRAQP